MSSYRSNYIPWQNSSPSKANKQNAKDSISSSLTNKRYPSRISLYHQSISNNTKNTSSPSQSQSPNSIPTYQYRKSTAPSILKKYANFTHSKNDKYTLALSSNKNETQLDSKNTSKSNIPKSKLFKRSTPLDSDVTNQRICQGNLSRLGTQITVSPTIKKNSQPFCEESASYSKNYVENVIFVSRATSPTFPDIMSSRSKILNDDVLLSEIPKYERNISTCNNSSQTDDEKLSSRIAALTSKFGGDLANGKMTKFCGYTNAKLVDSPVRTSSLTKFYPNSVKLEHDTMIVSSNLHQAVNTIPHDTYTLRTSSPLTTINKTLNNLKIENAESDSENESSYEENYPMTIEKESYSLMCQNQNTTTSEFSDKPPKYPLSPKLKPVNLTYLVSENKFCNFRPANAGSTKLDSSSEDLSERTRSDNKIPLDSDEHKFETSKDDENDFDNIRKLYPLRKMDSEEQPWWLNSGSETSQERPESRGYVIRKMDSTEVPWWNKETDSVKSENRNTEQSDVSKSESEGISWWYNSNQNLNNERQESTTDNQNSTVGYVIRKMDSFDIPWWCKSDDNKSVQKDDQENNSNYAPETDDELKTTFRIRKMDSKEVIWGNNSDDSNSCSHLKSANNADQQTSSPPDKDLSMYKIRKFNSGDRDWWAEDERSKTGTPDWYNSKQDDFECVEHYKNNKSFRIKKIEQLKCGNPNEEGIQNEYRIMKIGSGDKPWWLENESQKKDFSKSDESCSEYGKQSENKLSENNVYKVSYINELENLLLYIGKFTNIDDLLGTEVPPPAAPVTPTSDTSDDEIENGCRKIAASEVKIHDGSAYTSTIHKRNRQLDDAALQLYKDGDYSSYLDLDSSISEQQEEFEGFQPKKDSIVVRTQLSIRVHLIIEKLMKSEGRELRRALFSLKQIFQEDKDLVHEFVQNDGLDCLIKVGSDVDQNYQNYILRALGQVMLYVDGMNGVMEHNPTIQWLYSLVSSKFRLVVKTALKLLLVFVEYVESNCLLLIQAIHTLNVSQGTLPWNNVMKLLHEYDVTDTELLIYAMTLINKTLNGIPDQDTYYDQVDLLEEQDIESVIRKYMSKQGTDLDLLRQFQIYEAVLQHEDGEDKGTPLKQLDETIRKTLRNRKLLTNGTVNSDERRKSRRHSTGTTALSHAVSLTLARHHSETSSPEEYRIKQTTDGAGVTPGLRRRRERAERQRSLLREQYECNIRALMDTSSSEDGFQNGTSLDVPHIYVNNAVNKIESLEDSSMKVRLYCNGEALPSLKREATVKDITQKLATLQTPDEMIVKPQSHGRVEEMKGIISKAMEGLAKSQSRCDMLKSPTNETPPSQIPIRATEIKKSETDLHWEELLATSCRPLQLCDLDFSDLRSDDDNDVLAPANNMNGVPPPPPPCAAPPPVPNIPKAIINKSKKTVKLFWKEVREDPIVITKLNSKQLIWNEIYPVIIDTQRLEHLFESRAKDLITKKQHELNKNKEIIVLDPKRSNAINIGMTKLPPPRSIKTAILKMDSTVMNREGIEKLLTMLPTEEERSKIQEAQVSNPDLPLGTAEHFLLTLASISELTARLKLWAFKLNYENIEKEIVDPLMDLKQGMEVLRVNKTFRAILSTLLSIGIFLNGTEVKGFQVEYLSKVPEVKDTVHKHSLLHHLCHMVMEKFPDSTDLYSEIGPVTRASRVDFDELSSSITRVEQECKASFDHLKAIAKHDGNTAVKLKLSDFLADCAERIIALSKIHRRILNRFHKFCLWLGIPLHRIQMTKPNELCKVISEFALEYRTTRERVIQQLEKKASHRERNKTRGKMITDIGKFRSKEDRQDAELRQLLGKEDSPEHDNANNLQCGSLPWRRLRKDNAKIMREQNLNGHLVDADDELLETLVKTATKTPASRNGTRERKRTRHSDRKSLIPKRSRTRDNMMVHGSMSESP